MKKTISVLIIGLALLGGCAFLEARKADWQACAADPVCVEHAKSWQSKGETVGTIVGGTAGSVFPGAAGIAGQVGKYGGGYLALAIAMILGGHAINKKKENPPQ